MARSLTPRDCYALINAMTAEMTGQQTTLQAVDTSSFISVGESLLQSGVENTLNALSIVLGRTFMAVRPYNAKLQIFNALNSGLYTNRIRKISYYSKPAQASGAFNTDLYTNHAQGFDNGSNPEDGVARSLPTMWEQNQPVPMEFNFGGRNVWDDSITIYEDQLQVAFRSEENFAAFVAGIMTQKGNDIEHQKEAYNRAILLNYIAGIYDLNAVNGAAIDLVADYNTVNGTSYTRDQLLTTYYKEFLAHVIAKIKKLSNLLTYDTAAFHWSPTKVVDGENLVILRHTPKEKQRLIMYRPFWIDAEAKVLPEIFNDQYLKPGAYEGVDFWQNFADPTSINVTPAIPNVANPASQKAGNAVQLDYVLGVLYDEDAIMVDYQLDASYSTPVEARKRYRNIWWHFAKNSINDFTEMGILLYLGEGGE